MKYYQDPNGHILEKSDNSGLNELFCKACNKLYNMRLDLTVMLKYYRCFYPRYSKEGLAILQKLQKSKQKALEAKLKWRQEHPDYSKNHRLSNPEYSERERLRKAQLLSDPVARKKARQSDRRYRAKPEVQARINRRESLRRSFIRKGLLYDPAKKYRLRQKLRRLHVIPPAAMPLV